MHIKNIAFLAGAAVASTLSLQAANVYTLDLSSGTNSADAGGHFLGDTGVGGDTQVVYDEVFGSTSASVSVTNGVGAAGTINLLEEAADTSRFRGAGVWVDSSSWGAGTVTVTFDISNFAETNAGTSVFQAYSQVGALPTVGNGVTLDLHGGDAAVTSAQGTAVLNTIAGTTAITGNGTGLSYSFVSDGTAEGVALTWTSTYAGAGATDVFSVSNVAIDVVPEPGTYALLAGLTGLVFVMVRRRRA
ncbi:PEP-CTERM sorting domain-containing protein [Coraliomargarita sp. W4R72]